MPFIQKTLFIRVPSRSFAVEKIPKLIAALAASLWLAAPAFAQTMPGTNPVKIFILAGESNTSGKGRSRLPFSAMMM